MEIRLDSRKGSLELTFSPAELERFVAELAARKAFLVPLAEELKLGTRLAVTLRRGDDFEYPLEAEVMHLFDSVTGDYGTACRVPEWDERSERELRAKLGGEASDPVGDKAPTLDGGVPAAEADESESLGASPIHRIREMNVSQRAHLAMRAGRQERQILLRDNSGQVLQALVSNPRLEATELLRIVRNRQVTAPTLERVARDPRWGKNKEILAAIANNPKTPSPLAVRLMRALNTSDLRRMGKMSSGLRENVRRAALKEYLGRTSRM